ncbi:hypothetical protein DL771_000723 [Monosporascus sp. 5C6A]|nr:hypothetical protein DL771_000723 [Monosporascus sp. 5C6A]
MEFQLVSAQPARSCMSELKVSGVFQSATTKKRKETTREEATREETTREETTREETTREETTREGDEAPRERLCWRGIKPLDGQKSGGSFSTSSRHTELRTASSSQCREQGISMDVTFGAVGDFISVGLLLKDLVDLLDDSRGSVWEYQALVEQLKILRQVVNQAENFCRQHCDSNDLQDVRDDLMSVIEEAKRRLKEVAAKVKKYAPSLSQGGSGNAAKDAARKVKWRLEKKETEKFRDDVMRYSSSIQSLLITATGRFMQRNHQDVEQLIQRYHEQTAGRFTTIETQLNVLQTQSSSIQEFLAGLGWIITARMDAVTGAINLLGLGAWKSTIVICSLGSAICKALLRIETSVTSPERPLGSGDYFILEDFVGQQSHICFSFIDSWDAFYGSLEGKFKGRKGGRRIAQRRFLLQDSDGGGEIDIDQSWEKAIRPYKRIDMSLICVVTEEEEDGDESSAQLKCRFCKTICEGVPGTSVQCKSCGNYFRILDGLDEDEDAPHAPDAPPSGAESPHSLNQHESNATGGDRAGDDLSGHRTKSMGQSKKKRRRKIGIMQSDGSDSDEADLTGLVRVAFLPTLLSAKRLETNEIHVEARFPSTGRIIGEQAEIEESTSAQESEATKIGIDSGANEDDSLQQHETHEAGDSTSSLSSPYYSHDPFPYSGVEKPAVLGSNASFKSSFSNLRRPTHEHLSQDPYYYAAERHGQSDEDEFMEIDVRHLSVPAPQRPQAARPNSALHKKLPLPREATEADARRWHIPAGYSLKNWDPYKEPILLLGSVFDANSLGKWIYDWMVYHHGFKNGHTRMAGELWLQLIQLAGKIKRAEEQIPKTLVSEDRGLVEDFVDSGHRLMSRLRRLLKACEQPMLRASKGEPKATQRAQDGIATESKESTVGDDSAGTSGTHATSDGAEMKGGSAEIQVKGSGQSLPPNSGIAFIETLFGRDKELEKTERFMHSVRLWNLRFDANCEEILRRKRPAPKPDADYEKIRPARVNEEKTSIPERDWMS